MTFSYEYATAQRDQLPTFVPITTRIPESRPDGSLAKAMYVLGYAGFSHSGAGPRTLRGAAPEALFHADAALPPRVLPDKPERLPLTLFPLSYFGHDSSASLLQDGRVVACASEERFSRTKFGVNLAGHPILPREATRYCLAVNGISIADVDIVAHYCCFSEEAIARRIDHLRPFLSPEVASEVERIYLSTFETVLCLEAVRRQFERMTGEDAKRFVPVSHHRAHAASAFFPSGFDEALVMTLDAYGEEESGAFYSGSEGRLTELETTPLPYSLGVLYLLVTVYLGFKSLGDEYKVMGLASYGNPARYREAFRYLFERNKAIPSLVDPGLRKYLRSAIGPPRLSPEPIEPRHADIAAALQEGLSDTVIASLRRMRAVTGARRLCMAGGVALNCAMNGAIARASLFDEIFIQPASGDDGGSLGAAYAAHADSTCREVRPPSPWDHAFWGPEYCETDLLNALLRHSDSVVWHKPDTIAEPAAEAIAQGNVVAWFQGRMEFGPRALGNRSILADPRRSEMKDLLNGRVKRRESFRPFAPAVLEESAAQYFDMTGLQVSPYMLFTVPVWPHHYATIPAVTHVDGTARVQTVSRRTHRLFWELIEAFAKRTGVPVVLNTSFNLRDEPIVCSPDDALATLLRGDIDKLALGPFLVEKPSTLPRR